VTKFSAAAVLAASIVLAGGASASERPNHSAESFSAATAVCLEALSHSSPKDVADALSDKGWRIENTTPIGGVFRQNKSSVRIKFQNVLGSYICTVFGNRGDAESTDEFAGKVESALGATFPDRLTEGKTRSSREVSYRVDQRFTVVLTLEGVEDGYDTKITSIATAS
jgi:hypothetical protein